MLQSLVITLREGVEAALVVGVVLTYLRRTGRQAWSRSVYAGLFAALGASLLGGFFLSRLKVAEEVYEGWLLVAGALFVVSMVVWMWRTGRRLKQDIEDRLGRISGEARGAGAAAVFLFVFLMVFREGVETVLFLAAVSFETTQLLNFMGAVIGLGLALILGIAFVKGSLKVNLRKFFSVTSAILLVVAAQLLISGIHELSEARILPSGPHEMALIGPIVNNDAFFFIVIVALSLVLLGAAWFRARKTVAPMAPSLPAPERRKLLAEQRRYRFWLATASCAAVVTIILISAELVYSRAAQSLSPAETVTLSSDHVTIPIAALADGKLRRYRLELEGKEMRFLAIQDNRGEVRVALDACLICGPRGYYQDGTNVICINCAAAIYVPSIGLPGGCNPIHVDYQVTGNEVVVKEAALRQARRYFP